jgi:hypothetical protein
MLFADFVKAANANENEIPFTNSTTIWQEVTLLLVSATALCALAAITLADSCTQQTNWRVISGDSFDGTNWSAGVPNSSKSAQINNGGTATISSAGAVSCDLTLGGRQCDANPRR